MRWIIPHYPPHSSALHCSTVLSACSHQHRELTPHLTKAYTILPMATPTATPAIPPPLDLTLYLVTSSQVLPPNTTLAKHVEAAIRGGVTIVQIREKSAETRDFIRIAREVHQVTKRYNVPLLINDRLDVALAIGCEGLHLGQSDMDYTTARRLLGPSAIIGLSVTTFKEGREALNLFNNDPLTLPNTTYVGIGTVFATSTKPDHTPPLGAKGVRDILASMELEGNLKNTKSVAIGGLHEDNVQRVLYLSTYTRKGTDQPLSLRLDGVAVVSAIMASLEPESASKRLVQLIKSEPSFLSSFPRLPATKSQPFPKNLAHILKVIVNATTPLVHHITNNVVKGFSANVTLAIGASPIMSENALEVADLAAINGGLVINMGTGDATNFESLALKAILENNKHGNPVIFDPVGCGATKFRRQLAMKVLRGGYCDVIKGNRGEIMSIGGRHDEGNMRGVDSSEMDLTVEQLCEIAAELAQNERNIVVMTGAVDIISDGYRTFTLSNGRQIMSRVTGTGCSLSSVIAAFLTRSVYTKVQEAYGSFPRVFAVMAAVQLYNLAAERADNVSGSSGPASWKVAFVDELYKLSIKTPQQEEWWEGVNVKEMFTGKDGK